MGAWIETPLKGPEDDVPSVAPYVGAWIETTMSVPRLQIFSVAPYMGAWIETRVLSLYVANI